MGLFDGSNLRQCRTDFALFIVVLKASALIIRNGTWPSIASAEPCLTPPRSILRPRERRWTSLPRRNGGERSEGCVGARLGSRRGPLPSPLVPCPRAISDTGSQGRTGPLLFST